MSSAVLFAHERPSVRRAVTRVLQLSGLDTIEAASGDEAAAILRDTQAALAALVVDVALPGMPGYELISLARELRPALVVVLVASVYRKTSYKRRPTSLYGADDYVEVHHLCDHLPVKLRRHLELPEQAPPPDDSLAGAEVLREEGDARFSDPSNDRLAELIVSDMVLYNGDRILKARSVEAARAAVSDDLDIARDLLAQVRRAEGRDEVGGDPVGDAFLQLMASMGRHGGP